MKSFFGLVGNPPYHKTLKGTSGRPIYNLFVDAAYQVAEKAELVTPARFLTKAGKTPKGWTERMLADSHLKVLFYEPERKAVFPGVYLNGGVAVTYRDTKREFTRIGLLPRSNELCSLLERIRPHLEGGCLAELIYPQNRFILEALYRDYPQYRALISSAGREQRIVSSAFNKLDVFCSLKRNAEDLQIVGLGEKGRRVCRWIDRRYIKDNGNLYAYKVILPKAYGSGEWGQVIGLPLIIPPGCGYTQTFMGFGCCRTHQEAEPLLKYLKSKFARACLSILKVTQDNNSAKWRCVPRPDLTSASDIDWQSDISDLDEQLYAKYDLERHEIDFIESHIDRME